MPRGQKQCDNCGTATGPRAFVCPNCGQAFHFKPKAARVVPGKRIDWTTLRRGDVIKVLKGSGPFWPLESGERECIGHSGRFRVHEILKDGIMAVGLSKRAGSGFSFIYMGEKAKSKYGVCRRPHRIRLMKRVNDAAT